MLTIPIGLFGGESGGGEGGGGGDPFPASVAVNIDLDATIAASFDDGVDAQKWLNLIASPSDGAAQSDYDFYRGADGSSSTDDPTHTGTVGDAAAYFAMDGGDFFKLVSATNPATFKDLHKTTGGPDFWLALAFKFISSGTAQFPFATMGSSINAPHIRTQLLTTDKFRLHQRGAANAISADTSALTDGTDYVVIMSHKHSSNITRIWINSSTPDVDGAHTFSTTTTDAATVGSIGARSNNSNQVANGTRIYAFSSGDEYLDNTKAGEIITLYRDRHSRVYT